MRSVNSDSSVPYGRQCFAADGPVKEAILGGNSARLYGLDPRAASASLPRDSLDSIKSEYRSTGIGPSNVAYGYVHRAPR